MSRLRVVLDVSAVPVRPVGAGRYTVALARALAPLVAERDGELVCVCRRDDAARWALAHGARALPIAPASRVGRLVFGEVGIGPALRVVTRRRAALDQVLHAPHYSVPSLPGMPVVVTVHDMTFHDHPEWHEPAKVAYFRRALGRAARRADLVICVSEATARRFCAVYVPRAPVVVIPHGVDHDAFTPDSDESADQAVLTGLGVRPPYLLHLGTLEPRKDVPTLIDAFSELAQSHADLRLVLAGREGWAPAALEAALQRPEVAGRILRLGYVADAALPALLRGAAAVVYPSLEEGFGLPALEALACGAPLVTTAGTVMAETAGGAALLAPPGDAAALAAAIDTALSGADGPPRRARGLEVARGHRWEEAAAAHLDAYRRVAR